MNFASLLLELMYRAAGFRHPTEHELLGAMRDAEPWVKVVLDFPGDDGNWFAVAAVGSVPAAVVATTEKVCAPCVRPE